jgi:hypothetical protein
MKLVGLRNRSGRCGEEKKSCTAGNPTPAIQSVVSPYANLAKISIIYLSGNALIQRAVSITHDIVVIRITSRPY